ncbi:type II secretion system protein, partial [Aliivibrio finisterrensis]
MKSCVWRCNFTTNCRFCFQFPLICDEP